MGSGAIAVDLPDRVPWYLPLELPFAVHPRLLCAVYDTFAVRMAGRCSFFVLLPCNCTAAAIQGIRVALGIGCYVCEKVNSDYHRCRVDRADQVFSASGFGCSSICVGPAMLLAPQGISLALPTVVPFASECCLRMAQLSRRGSGWCW